MAARVLWLTVRWVEKRLGLSVTRLPARATDAVLAGVLVVALVGVRVLEAHGRHDFGGAAWLCYALSVVAALAVVGRRRWPLVVFAVTLTVAVIAITAVAPKLDARDRAQLVVLAYQTGLVIAGERIPSHNLTSRR